MILSRLDYCNSTLSGLPSSCLNRLQKVQNNAARLVLRKRKSDHVTPLLKQLHWLPVQARIIYKIATLAYKFFDGCPPPYLSVLLETCTPARSLRSSSERLLKTPKTNLNSAGNILSLSGYSHMELSTILSPQVIISLSFQKKYQNISFPVSLR